jgi:hypothetical protein
MVADIANLLLVQRILPVVRDLAVVGKYWVPNFIKQYKVLKSKLSCCQLLVFQKVESGIA